MMFVSFNSPTMGAQVEQELINFPEVVLFDH